MRIVQEIKAILDPKRKDNTMNDNQEKQITCTMHEADTAGDPDLCCCKAVDDDGGYADLCLEPPQACCCC